MAVSTQLAVARLEYILSVIPWASPLSDYKSYFVNNATLMWTY